MNKDDEMAFCVSSITYWSFLFNLIRTVASLSLSVPQPVHQGETGGAVTLEWLLTDPTHISPESVTFHCTCVNPKPVKTFCVNDKYIKYPEHQDEQYRGRVRWEREALQNGTLRFHLSDLTTQDSGTYHCSVAVGDEEDYQITFLNVTDLGPPAQGPNTENDFQEFVPPAPALKLQKRGQYAYLGAVCLTVQLVYFVYLIRRNCDLGRRSWTRLRQDQESYEVTKV